MGALLLAGYLGGVVFGLLTALFTQRAGGNVTWRFILPLTMLWPVALPLFVLLPGVRPRRFRA